MDGDREIFARVSDKAQHSLYIQMCVVDSAMRETREIVVAVVAVAVSRCISLSGSGGIKV